MKNKKERGLSPITVIVAGLAILLIGIFVFYFLNTASLDTGDTVSKKVMTEEQKVDETAEVSDSDEIDVIEEELDNTLEGSFESDFQSIDEEASFL